MLRAAVCVSAAGALAIEPVLALRFSLRFSLRFRLRNEPVVGDSGDSAITNATLISVKKIAENVFWIVKLITKV